jgi:hypothetical protein
MDMDPSGMWVTPQPFAVAVRMFGLVWPFVVLGFLRSRGRSSVPLAAMIVPFAMATCGTWVGLINVLRGASISGGGRASMAAGIAEALTMLIFGAFSASAVALVALIRRHRPVADRGVLILTVLIVANAVAAIVMTPAWPQVWIGAWTALGIAVAAFVWLFAVACTIVAPHPHPLPRYAVAVFASIAGVAILAWRHAEAFMHIARYGQ